MKSVSALQKMVFPQILLHGALRELFEGNSQAHRGRSIIEIAAGLEIDVIKHTINVEMLNTIMILEVYPMTFMHN